MLALTKLWTSNESETAKKQLTFGRFKASIWEFSPDPMDLPDPDKRAQQQQPVIGVRVPLNGANKETSTQQETSTQGQD